MELIVLVTIPSMFVMFFPNRMIALMLCIAACTRLCYTFSAQCRSRPIKSVDLWSLGGSMMGFTVAFNVEDERLCAALSYFAFTLLTRFIVSLFIHREYSYTHTVDSMKALNIRFQHSIEQLSSEYERGISDQHLSPDERLKYLQDKRFQLLKLENRYNERMKVLSARLDELEPQREDAQQLMFNLQERLDQEQARLTQSDRTRFFDPQAQAINAHAVQLKFEEALQNTERELDIFSPCMSFKVVRLLKPVLKELLSNPEITVKIRYSLSDSSDTRNKITQKVAKMLRKEFKKYPNFAMCRDELQSKLFICDDKFYVLSNFNVLAFNGECDECSDNEYSSNVAALKQYRDRYFRFEGETL